MTEKFCNNCGCFPCVCPSWGRDNLPTPIADQVLEFSQMIGAFIQFEPKEPPDDVMRLRLRLVLEEAFELLAASCQKGAQCSSTGSLWEDRIEEFRAHLFDRIIEKMPIGIDMVACTDACADIDYVVEGTRLALGVQGRGVARLVHESNMAKVSGKADGKGKWRKPEGWTPPDIRGELRRQGWRG